MSDLNKLLWFLFTVSICTINSIMIKSTNSKIGLRIAYCLSVVILLLVCIIWVYLDFWK